MRENFVFKIVPMVNPDGVFLGNNRCNLVGQDMNRCWNVASEFSSPTILATKNMLKELDNSEVFPFQFKLYTFFLRTVYFSATKLISSSISMLIPALTEHLSMAIPMRTSIATNVIWCFRSCCQRTRMTLHKRIWCLTLMIVNQGRVVAFAANDYRTR